MIRIGQGYDLHRLVPGRPLIIGGIKIPFPRGLAGHSDADVLIHAIIDALLGAAALGNIGRCFPDTEEEYKNADSTKLLSQIRDHIVTQGWHIANIDTTIIAERPRLNQYLDAMSACIAHHLSLKKSSVSIKAKTNEGVGPEGRCEAISALAVVLLISNDEKSC